MHFDRENSHILHPSTNGFWDVSNIFSFFLGVVAREVSQVVELHRFDICEVGTDLRGGTAWTVWSVEVKSPPSVSDLIALRVALMLTIFESKEATSGAPGLTTNGAKSSRSLPRLFRILAPSSFFAPSSDARSP